MGMIKKDIERLSEKLADLKEAERDDREKKTLDWTKIGVWIAAFALIIMAAVSVFDIKVNTLKDDQKQKEAAENVLPNP